MFNSKKPLINVFIIALVIGIVLFPNKLAKYEENIPKDDRALADSNTPKLVTPAYNTNHFIIADFVLSPANGDRTDDIQYALNVCNSNGGGTVYLEKGIYNVSKQITIFSNCTLMGDWQDPDNYQGTLDYGTKIVVDVNTFDKGSGSGLFKLNASSGVEGLTICYKNQNLNNPVSQPWTFYYDMAMLFTIKNVTMINSYNGIGRSTSSSTVMYAHEMLMIENVKGTVLNRGVLIHNSSDVGTITGLTLTPKYWANANLKAFGDNINNYSVNEISQSIKSHGGIGLTITDVEQSQYANVTLSGFKYGIYIPDASVIKTRAMGSGSFYNLNISDCNIGFMADKGEYEGKSLVDYHWGYVISNSTIGGSDYAIYNDSPLIRENYGTLKLNDVSVNGKVGGVGAVIHNNGTSYVAVPKNADQTGKITNTNRFYNFNVSRNLKNGGKNIATLSSANSVDDINNTLANVSANGGGVVYLKPGVYKISKTINVPANVELRGAGASSTRVYSRGTVISVTTNITAVSINGNNSGVFGINFIYENNVNSLKKGTSYSTYSYTIMANNSNNIYIKNISIAAASHGIYLNNCSNFSVENIVTGVMDNAIRVDNSSNGLIMNCLQNGTVIHRNELIDCGSDSMLFNNVFPNTFDKLKYIYLSGDKNIEVVNCFTYGSNTFLVANNSSIYAANSGYDGVKGTFYSISNADGWLVNGLKMGGVTFSGSGGFGFYNIANIGDVRENDRPATSLNKKMVDPTLTLSENSITLSDLNNKIISYQYNGDGNISCTSQDTSIVKCSIDVNKKEVTITPLKTSGSTTITISASKGSNYNAKSVNISITMKSTTSTTAPVNPSSIKGDVNGDGKVSSQDYVLIRKHIMGTKLTGNELKNADANNDGNVNSLDYIYVKKMIIGSTQNNSSNATTSVPTINNFSQTSFKDTTINSSKATTTICNLGSDSSGLQIIEYSTSCSSSKTANISNGCATITIDACKNSSLTYKLKNSSNYSSAVTVNDIGKYLIYAQVYNQLLYVNSVAPNDSNNLASWVSNNKSVSESVRNIGNIALNQNNINNETIIRYMYKAILGRDADANGLRDWTNSLKTTSKANVLSSFVNSGEAKEIYTAWGYN